MEDFWIEKTRFEDNFATAAVHVGFDETVNGFEVSQVARITVRIAAAPTMTLEELEQAVMKKAVETMKRAADVCTGKSARELLSAVQETV